MAGELTVAEVGSNILELARAAEGHMDQLTPGLGGTVATTGLMQKALWAGYSVIEFVYSPDVRLHQVKDSIQLTKAAFDVRVDEITRHYAAYQKQLLRRRGGYAVDEQQVKATREAITSWNNAFQSDLKTSLQRANKACRTVFDKTTSRFSLRRLMPKRETFVFKPQLEDIARCQKLIDLEATLNTPVPITALAALALEKEPQGTDLQALTAWIEKLNRARLAPSNLHEALVSIREQLGGEGDAMKSVWVVEQQLQQKGLTLFDSGDAEFVTWRNNLRPGAALHIGKSTYVLGKSLGKPRGAKDHHLVYEVKGDSNKVIVLGANPAQLGIRLLAGSKQSLLPQADILAIGDRFVVMERLQQSLEAHRWKTIREPVDSDDEAFAAPVVQLLRNLIALSKTPKISCKDLMYAQDGTLKSTRGIEGGTQFEFDRLVQLAADASQDNLPLFKHLLNASGIAQHVQARFYRAVIEDALKNESKGVNEVALKGEFTISDAAILNKAKALRDKILELRSRLSVALPHYYHVSWTKENTESILNWALLKAYDDTVGAGLLWPWFDDIVRALIEQQYKLRRK